MRKIKKFSRLFEIENKGNWRKLDVNWQEMDSLWQFSRNLHEKSGTISYFPLHSGLISLFPPQRIFSATSIQTHAGGNGKLRKLSWWKITLTQTWWLWDKIRSYEVISYNGFFSESNAALLGCLSMNGLYVVNNESQKQLYFKHWRKRTFLTQDNAHKLGHAN